MANSDRDQVPFRLSAEHRKSLDKAAKYCGQSRQAFVTAAVLAEVAEVLEGRRMKKQRASHNFNEDKEPREDLDASTASAGMGIGDALRQRRAAREETIAPTTQAPVVVNVGNSGSSAPSSDVDRLATYVVTGSAFGRETRLRTAVAVLKASAPTDEEQRALAKRLDEAIAAKAKTATDEESSGIKRITRIAFDKFADFWEGD